MLGFAGPCSDRRREAFKVWEVRRRSHRDPRTGEYNELVALQRLCQAPGEVNTSESHHLPPHSVRRDGADPCEAFIAQHRGHK